MRRRQAAFFLTASAALGVLAFGLQRAEFRETLMNAVLICLSCIGIG